MYKRETEHVLQAGRARCVGVTFHVKPDVSRAARWKSCQNTRLNYFMQGFALPLSLHLQCRLLPQIFKGVD